MLVDNISQKLAARPVPPGWALDLILCLDDAQPGFLRFLHTASDLRRQCVYFALTQLDWDRPDVFAGWIARAREGSRHKQDAPLSVIASGLMSMRVRDIIHSLFGSIPNGLVGALTRCGHDPLDHVSYLLLHAICDGPKNKARAGLLRYVRVINDAIVEVVWRLPPALLRKEVLNQIKTAEDIAQYSPALRLIQRLHPTITEDDLAFSFSQVSKAASLASWVRRWIERAEHLPPSLPYAGDEALRPLMSGADMKDVALRYRNCLRGRIASVALGRVLFYEHSGEPGALAEVVALSDGRWLLEAIYAPHNDRPTPRVIGTIRMKLERAGVLVPAAHVQDTDVETIANMLGSWEYSGRASLNWRPELLEGSG